MHARAAEKAIADSYSALPCGCECWNEWDPATSRIVPDPEAPGYNAGLTDSVFVYIPCSLSCEYYRYALDESARLGHPIQIQEDRS
jgi:hypothetical protein